MKTKVLSLPDDVNPTKSNVEQIEPNLSINCYSIFERNRHDRNRHGLERQNFVRLVRLQFSVRLSILFDWHYLVCSDWNSVEKLYVFFINVRFRWRTCWWHLHSLYIPAWHKTLFQRTSNVHNVHITLDERWNNVVCQLGI